MYYNVLFYILWNGKCPAHTLYSIFLSPIHLISHFSLYTEERIKHCFSHMLIFFKKKNKNKLGAAFYLLLQCLKKKSKNVRRIMTTLPVHHYSKSTLDYFILPNYKVDGIVLSLSVKENQQNETQQIKEGRHHLSLCNKRRSILMNIYSI